MEVKKEKDIKFVLDMGTKLRSEYEFLGRMIFEQQTFFSGMNNKLLN